MIEVKNLVKEFEDKQVLKGVSVVFKSATTNLIIGKSGADGVVEVSHRANCAHQWRNSL